jgi:hypothetical protein
MRRRIRELLLARYPCAAPGNKNSILLHIRLWRLKYVEFHNFFSGGSFSSPTCFIPSSPSPATFISSLGFWVGGWGLGFGNWVPGYRGSFRGGHQPAVVAVCGWTAGQYGMVVVCGRMAGHRPLQVAEDNGLACGAKGRAWPRGCKGGSGRKGGGSGSRDVGVELGRVEGGGVREIGQLEREGIGGGGGTGSRHGNAEITRRWWRAGADVKLDLTRRGRSASGLWR